MVNFDSLRLSDASARASHELLDARASEGYWPGELSSSALATATAVCALTLADQEWKGKDARLPGLVERGLEWLAKNANGDGGWGDTTRSFSNISTSALCWSAFGLVPGGDDRYATVVHAAERWLIQNAGNIKPSILVPALMNRYGKDRTFSTPILMTCALAGRLGDDVSAWRHVPQLPFQLAALPREWFAALRLPVVSYALPALIALGHARHHNQPGGSFVGQMARELARARTLKVLAEIQPSHGGFLEAVPLTSFVALGLLAAGLPRNPVVEKCVGFLADTVRPDGSWAIDTNLSTWLSTLSVQALVAPAMGPESLLTVADSHALRTWLIGQQCKGIHPYTMAQPGGWAWTNLPGGVPDADDTAGALLALRLLGDLSSEVIESAKAGVNWLVEIQNADGGIPTFCRGWGTLPFDRSSTDITAHALRAWLAWLHVLAPEQQHRVQTAMSQAVQFLIRSQRDDGSWTPLWFGNQYARGETNATYGTARVLCALPELAARSYLELVEALNSGVLWLIKSQNTDGSWGGGYGGPPSVEETALAVEALAESLAQPQPLLVETREQAKNACTWGANWLVQQVESGAWQTPAPIGFYFAKLWYYEKLYPLINTVAALRKVARLV
jgi:squalene-hopene/tetraprenyl-beta-curcumene cyclase